MVRRSRRQQRAPGSFEIDRLDLQARAGREVARRGEAERRNLIDRSDHHPSGGMQPCGLSVADDVVDRMDGWRIARSKEVLAPHEPEIGDISDADLLADNP